jgi:hypothetical protein
LSVARFPAWLALAAILMAGPAAAAPSWTVGPAPSDFPELEAASALSAGGDQLFVWANHRDDRFQIFAEVHLAPPRAFGDTLPTYRIDDGAPIDVEQIRQEGEARSALTAHVRDNISFWLVWSSPIGVIAKDAPLHEWLTGKVLTLRYTSAAGVTGTVEFPLDGAAAAIPEATGVEAAP